MNTSRRSVLVAGLAGALGLPAVHRARAAAPVTLRAVMQGDLRVFDPIWTTANITAYYGAMVYDTLFAIDEHFRPQPRIVGEDSVSDAKSPYQLVLRDGLCSPDGTPVTAADLVASLH